MRCCRRLRLRPVGEWAWPGVSASVWAGCVRGEGMPGGRGGAGVAGVLYGLECQCGRWADQFGTATPCGSSNAWCLVFSCQCVIPMTGFVVLAAQRSVPSNLKFRRGASLHLQRLLHLAIVTPCSAHDTSCSQVAASLEAQCIAHHLTADKAERHARCLPSTAHRPTGWFGPTCVRSSIYQEYREHYG